MHQTVQVLHQMTDATNLNSKNKSDDDQFHEVESKDPKPRQDPKGMNPSEIHDSESQV